MYNPYNLGQDIYFICLLLKRVFNQKDYGIKKIHGLNKLACQLGALMPFDHYSGVCLPQIMPPFSRETFFNT